MKKLAFIIVVLVLCRHSCWSISKTIDSLKARISQSDSDTSKCNLLNNLAWEYLEVNPDSGLIFSEDALNLATEINYAYGKAFSLGNQGALYEVKGDYPKAMKCYLTSYDIYQNMGEMRLSNSIRHNIGLLFAQIGDHENALEYYLQSLNFDSLQNQTQDVLIDCLNIGGAYKSLNRSGLALYYYRKGLRVAKEVDFREFNFYNNLASLFLQIHELDSAHKYIELSRKETGAHSNQVYRVYNLLNTGQYHMANGNLDSAEICIQKAFLGARELSYADVRLDGLKLLAEIYRKKQDFRKASSFQLRYTNFKDSILDLRRRAQIDILEQRLRLDDKERIIANLETERALELDERRILIIAFTLVVLISVLTVTLLWQNRMKNLKLSERNEVIEQQLIEINTLAKESHHRIKNNLQVVSSLLKLQSNHVVSQAAKNALNEAYGRVRTIALIHQKLYKDDSFSKVDLSEFMDQLLSNISSSMDIDHSAEISMDIAPLWVKFDTAIFIGLIVNELVTNSFKYAFREEDIGEIGISVSQNGGTVIIEVRDNGVGYPEKLLEASADTFGLNIVKSLLRIFKGQLEVYNDQGAISKVTLNEIEILKSN